MADALFLQTTFFQTTITTVNNKNNYYLIFGIRVLFFLSANLSDLTDWASDVITESMFLYPNKSRWRERNATPP